MAIPLSISEIFKGLTTPEAFLQKAAAHFPGKVVFTTSLGLEDQVITSMIARAQLDINIVTLDTGRLFPSAYELLQRTTTRYKVPIKVYFPNTADVEDFVNTHGINSFYDSVELRKSCCHIRKVEPLRRALAGNTIWITGIRKEQSENRQEFPHVEWDAQNQIIKIHPLLDWTETMLWDYIDTQFVPYNPLHKEGYPTIGCAPCTRAVQPGEHPRAGRWWWEQGSQECGLHVTKKTVPEEKKLV